ncbi:MAG: BACON domain-containing protein [Chitinophagaceae bacterium]|nr:BACON domain-containing protein [Chitinophagaceae bacterium]
MKHLWIPAIVCILFSIFACTKRIPQPDRFLDVDKNTVAFGGNADSRDTIFISSNDEWAVVIKQDVDWLTVTPSSGTGDGMIVISATANMNTVRRTTNIEVKSGSNTELITVLQLQLNETIVNAVFGGEANDSFNDITTTPDGGFIAVGASSSMEGDGTGGKGGQDVWIVKFNSEGNKLWHKKFGGTQDDAANSIVRVSADKYLVLATTLSTDGDVTNNKGDRDAWLMSIDGEGNLQWQKTIGGSAEDRLYNLKIAGGGNFLMVGWTHSSDGDVSDNAGDADAWIVSVDGDGNIVWEETYGGTKEDRAYDVTPVSDGGYIFCGGLLSADGDAADNTSPAFATWIVKLNAARAIGGKVYLGESEFDYGTVVLEASNGDYVIAGQTGSSSFDNYHAGKDIFICRLDGAGSIRWKKAYGGNLSDEPGDLVETDSGDFVIGGLTTSEDGDVDNNSGGEDAWLFRINGDGDIVNSLLVGGEADDGIKKIIKLNNTHFAFVGLSGSYEDAYPDITEAIHGWFHVVSLP